MKQIPSCHNYYAKRDGTIYNSKYMRLLNPTKPGNHGYYEVNINGKTRLVHRLILETFVGPCPEGMECRHLDGNKLNNHVDNLQWGSRSENVQDAIKHGTFKAQPPDNTGSKNGMSKLTRQDVKEIRKLYKSKKLNQYQLAEKFNIDQSNISCIVRRKTWKHI